MPGTVLLAAFLLQLPPLASSYPTGAPASACADMIPRHGGVQAQPVPAPYTIYISNHTFRVDEPVTVTIKGPNYTGLLLRAQSGSRAEALGTWQPPPANTKYLHASRPLPNNRSRPNGARYSNTSSLITAPISRVLQCSGNAHGAITHSNIDIKDNNTLYTWIPPRGVDHIHFVATVAQEKTVFWVNIKSESLTREATGLPDGSPPLQHWGVLCILLPILLLTLLSYS
ncbi:putative defense protein Hdd11 isoform X1 [Brienomyrus brachyistius]|uniref:putative defense protein Hdd11 isoform X1 n=1 Tax=Brienomyrus brachyistius TaxID=42636 RepID=UPI0020B3566D|nr:putative defense protein Hdd11 isoform X1 [Brienomyrus brachyistius]